MIDLYLFKGNPMLFMDFARDFISEFFRSCNVVKSQSTGNSKADFKLDDLSVTAEMYKDRNHQPPLQGDD